MRSSIRRSTMSMATIVLPISSPAWNLSECFLHPVPYGGHLIRPSDKKEPKKIAWIQCIGSRDVHRRRAYCSAVCCTYAIKEAIVAKEHAKGHWIRPSSILICGPMVRILNATITGLRKRRASVSSNRGSPIFSGQGDRRPPHPLYG